MMIRTCAICGYRLSPYSRRSMCFPCGGAWRRKWQAWIREKAGVREITMEDIEELKRIAFGGEYRGSEKR